MNSTNNTCATIISETEAQTLYLAKSSYYFIALTGSEQKMYTLWSTAAMGRDSYHGVIGASLDAAIVNFERRINPTNATLLNICDDQSQDINRMKCDGQKVTFGKYKGNTLEQIHQEDEPYFFWIAEQFGIKKNGQQYSPVKWADRCAKWVRQSLIEIVMNLRERRTSANLESSVSQFLGDVKEKVELTLLCESIKVIKSRENDTFLYKFKSGENLVVAYGKEGQYIAGGTYEVKAKIAAVNTYEGVKSTRINYVKIA